MKRVGSFKLAVIFGVLALGVTTLAFQNCSQAPEISNSSLNSNSGTGAVDPNKLVIAPTDTLIAAGTTQAFRITGGTQPYTWAVTPIGCGTFDTATKTYTAPAGSNVCTFSITDATGKQVRSIISVAENTLSATYTPNPASASAVVEISPVGGTPGYSFSLIAGGGSLSGYIYRAPASAETAIVRITDSKGKSIDLSIAIGGGGSGGTGSAGTQQIFRMVASAFGDIMTTKTLNEGSPTYVNQPGGTIKTFTTASSTRKEIFRCWNGSSHFVALSGACGGASPEGSLGFIENAQTSAATKQIFMCSSSSTFLTTNSAECGSGGASIGFAP